MARLDKVDEMLRSIIESYQCPKFETMPWVDGPQLNKRRIAIVSTAGLQHRDDRPFEDMSGEYRIIPGVIRANDLIMSHISTNFDRTGFEQDWNIVFPLDRLKELAEQGTIGSVADFHYSFMGATDATQMEPIARNLAKLLIRDKVDGVLLVPV